MKGYKCLITTAIFIMSTSVGAYAETNNSFSNLADVEKNIYQHLENRDNTFSFTYTGDKTEFKNSIVDIIKKAYSEDDYTERSWLLIDPKATVSGNEIDTSINVNYLTTKQQEDYVDTELKNVVSQLIKPTMNNLEKVRAINNYIITRYSYDISLQSNNAYSALVTGKATCQGYSMTAYKMLKLAGINSRIIVGTLNGTSHSWNCVELQNKWYHLDITNNDSTRTDNYFLVLDNVLEYNNYAWNKEDYPQAV